MDRHVQQSDQDGPSRDDHTNRGLVAWVNRRVRPRAGGGGSLRLCGCAAFMAFLPGCSALRAGTGSQLEAGYPAVERYGVIVVFASISDVAVLSAPRSSSAPSALSWSTKMPSPSLAGMTTVFCAITLVMPFFRKLPPI
jgi:hypothetical protein